MSTLLTEFPRCFQLLWAGLSLAVLCGCGSSGGPAAPPAPDYAQSSAWLALPGPGSIMNDVPPGSGLSNLQGVAPADVFYVLPTTGNYPKSAGPNVAYDDPQAFAFAQKIGAMQATPFNGIGRVYAPLYRGVNNWVWGSPLGPAQAPLDLAYNDVKRAFDYYLAHYNKGRPFILAGHSQGDVHPMRLIYDEIAGTPLARQLVGAYVIGQPVASNFFDLYPNVKACQSATDLGCQITYDAYDDALPAANRTAIVDQWSYLQYYWLPQTQAWDGPRPPFYPSMNPLTWRYDAAPVPASANLGSMQTHIVFPVPPGSPRLEPLIVPGVVGATSAPGALFVSPTPPRAQFSAVIDGAEALDSMVYHPIDFQLFWMNIRVNARDRTNAWLLQAGAAYPLTTGPITASATSGAPFAYATATLNVATQFNATGLPPGLAIDPVSGQISGTPVQAGTYAVQIVAGNAAGASTGELWLTVH